MEVLFIMDMEYFDSMDNNLAKKKKSHFVHSRCPVLQWSVVFVVVEGVCVKFYSIETAVSCRTSF